MLEKTSFPFIYLIIRINDHLRKKNDVEIGTTSSFSEISENSSISNKSFISFKA